MIIDMIIDMIYNTTRYVVKCPRPPRLYEMVELCPRPHSLSQLAIEHMYE